MTFTTFKALADHVAQEQNEVRRQQNAEDIRRAKNLRKSPSRRANLAPGSGPRVAR